MNDVHFFVKLAMAAGISLVIAAAIDAQTPRDSTDPPDGRSGLVIMRDEATGCEYLRTGPFFGGLTPRIDQQGRPICRPKML